MALPQSAATNPFTRLSHSLWPEPAPPVRALALPANTAPARVAGSGPSPQPVTVLHGTILPSLLEEPVLELELSLAEFDGSRPFTEEVTAAARALGGDFLFALPASDLIPDADEVAAVRLFSNGEWITVFACLEQNRQTIRIEQADERTARLHAFAGAFVHLLERF